MATQLMVLLAVAAICLPATAAQAAAAGASRRLAARPHPSAQSAYTPDLLAVLNTAAGSSQHCTVPHVGIRVIAVFAAQRTPSKAVTAAKLVMRNALFEHLRGLNASPSLLCAPGGWSLYLLCARSRPGQIMCFTAGSTHCML